MTKSNVLTGKKRVEMALCGGKPEVIPIVPIYDYAYIMNAIGCDVREWITASSDERTGFIEKALLRHPEVDGYFVHEGTSPIIADN